MRVFGATVHNGVSATTLVVCASNISEARDLILSTSCYKDCDSLNIEEVDTNCLGITTLYKSR